MVRIVGRFEAREIGDYRGRYPSGRRSDQVAGDRSVPAEVVGALRVDRAVLKQDVEQRAFHEDVGGALGQLSVRPGARPEPGEHALLRAAGDLDDRAREPDAGLRGAGPDALVAPARSGLGDEDGAAGAEEDLARIVQMGRDDRQGGDGDGRSRAVRGRAGSDKDSEAQQSPDAPAERTELRREEADCLTAGARRTAPLAVRRVAPEAGCGSSHRRGRSQPSEAAAKAIFGFTFS